MKRADLIRKLEIAGCAVIPRCPPSYDKTMKFTVTIQPDEDGVYIAQCPSIPGCVSQGLTEAEAEANIADAIRECVAARAEMGMPSAAPTREVEVAV